MGNCIRHESPMQRGGDDWGSTAGDEDDKEDEELTNDKDGLLGERVRSGRPEAEMVKVKITKRQLEELLGRVDVKELSAHQAVAQLLMTAAASTHHRPWRPALQSIPEAN